MRTPANGAPGSLSETDKTGLPSNPKVMRQVLSVVRAEPFIHFNLACGHMITEAVDGRPQPAKMECWACGIEGKKQ